jgi:hypothetical protein
MKSDQQSRHEVVQGNYVFPPPPRGRGALIVSPVDANEEASSRPSEAADNEPGKVIGACFQSKADSLDHLLKEVRGRLELLDASVAEDSRAQIKGALRELVHVVDWCDAVQEDLSDTSQMVSDGLEPIDVSALCHDLAASVQANDACVTVSTSRDVIYWGDRKRLARLIQAALALVLARTGGRGLRQLEVLGESEDLRLRVCSKGEPSGDVDPEAVDTFRQAAAIAGALVQPDQLGPGGAGLVLQLSS